MAPDFAKLLGVSQTGSPSPGGSYGPAGGNSGMGATSGGWQPSPGMSSAASTSGGPFTPVSGPQTAGSGDVHAKQSTRLSGAQVTIGGGGAASWWVIGAVLVGLLVLLFFLFR